MVSLSSRPSMRFGTFYWHNLAVPFLDKQQKTGEGVESKPATEKWISRDAAKSRSNEVLWTTSPETLTSAVPLTIGRAIRILELRSANAMNSAELKVDVPLASVEDPDEDTDDNDMGTSKKTPVKRPKATSLNPSRCATKGTRSCRNIFVQNFEFSGRARPAVKGLLQDSMLRIMSLPRDRSRTSWTRSMKSWPRCSRITMKRLRK